GEGAFRDLDDQARRAASGIAQPFDSAAGRIDAALRGIGEGAFRDLDNAARRAASGIEGPLLSAAAEVGEALELAVELDPGVVAGQASAIAASIDGITDAALVADRVIESAVELDPAVFAGQAAVVAGSLDAIAAAGVGAGASLDAAVGPGLLSKLSKLAFPIAAIGAAVLAAGGAIAGFGLKAAGDLEQVQVAFTGLFDNSSQKASDFLKKLQEFANRTPFEFSQITGPVQQLIGNLGQTGDQAIETLRTVGNAASAAGKGGDVLGQIIAPLTQIKSLGKLTADNLNQISNALPNFSRVKLVENLATALNITKDAAADMLANGLIPADVGVAAILRTLGEARGAGVDAATGLDAMGRQSLTLNGLLSTLADTVKTKLITAFAPLVGVVKEALPGITDAIGGALDAAAPAISRGLAGLLPSLTKALEPVGKLFGQLFEAAATIAAPLVEAIGEIADALARSGVVRTFSGALLAVFDALRPLLRPLTEVVTVLLPPLLDLVKRVAEALKPFVAKLSELASRVIGVLANVLDRLISSGVFDKLLDALGQIAAVTLLAFVQFIDDL
ncbi:MAG TPA: tape measure protein, partial [Dongiaceae bacterium]|nr:tape measure protein [Dongiaceae bacterium]